MKVCFYGNTGHFFTAFVAKDRLEDIEFAAYCPGCQGEDMGQLGGYFRALFGGAPAVNAGDLYQLRSYLPMLVILTIGSTPLMKRLWERLGERARSVLTPVLMLGALVLCTASLVDASYNPFLYFRF